MRYAYRPGEHLSVSDEHTVALVPSGVANADKQRSKHTTQATNSLAAPEVRRCIRPHFPPVTTAWTLLACASSIFIREG